MHSKHLECMFCSSSEKSHVLAYSITGVDSFPDNKLYIVPNQKTSQKTILTLMKMTESSLNG